MLKDEDKNCLGGCKQAERTILAFSSTLMPPSPPASLGCRHSTLAQKRSASLSLKPISALGCRPKARGVSGGMASSMYSNTCSQGIKALGTSFSLTAMSCSPPERERCKVLSASARGQDHDVVQPVRHKTTNHAMGMEGRNTMLQCHTLKTKTDSYDTHLFCLKFDH